MKAAPAPLETPILDQTQKLTLTWRNWFRNVGDAEVAANSVKAQESTGAARTTIHGNLVWVRVEAQTLPRAVPLPRAAAGAQHLTGMSATLALVAVPLDDGSISLPVPANTVVWGAYICKENV